MKKNIHYYQDGFTLVELLAVIIVLVTVGAIIFGVLFASLRGSNRATVLTDVQENGDYVLQEMARSIRFAQAVTAPESCVPGPTPGPIASSSVTIRNYNNTQTTYTCTAGDDATIASNGASLLDLTAVELTACSFSCSQNTLYEAPTIGISFELNKKDANSLIDNNAPITFGTTVTLRNKIQ